MWIFENLLCFYVLKIRNLETVQNVQVVEMICTVYNVRYLTTLCSYYFKVHCNSCYNCKQLYI